MTTRGKRSIIQNVDAGWSSLEARRAHNPKVTGSNPVPATQKGIRNAFLFYVRNSFLAGSRLPKR